MVPPTVPYDAAGAVELILLRPNADRTDARPVAALAIQQHTPDHTEAEHLTKHLLAESWDLVAAPVGQYEPPSDSPVLARTRRGAGSDAVTVTDHRGETIYDGSVSTTPVARESWMQLARIHRAVVILFSVGGKPLDTDTALDDAARAGRLLGTWSTFAQPGQAFMRDGSP